MQPSPSTSEQQRLIPMTETSMPLIETSFAQATATILAAEELPEQTRRHWATSLRQTAKLLGRPPEVIPARYSAVRADLLNLHEVPAGLTAKTLQNHKSNAKSALLWLAKEKGIPEHGAPLMGSWEVLRGKIRDSLVRYRLSSLMRFASANGIAPRGGRRGSARSADRLSQRYRPAGRQRLPSSLGAGLERQCGEDRRLAGA